ncbi:MFS transporter [Streptomyces sp. NPDC020141]|uniref:MFS transporter n=1 Tax=Streptomyces sp. NPDC020141 TaxID=3365065 RepID=UPI0037AB31A5
MPVAITVLGIAVFCLNTTEIMIAGLLPSLSAEFGVSVSTVGYLISVYALGMVVGGPVLTVALLRVPRKAALLGLLTVFMAGQVLGALAEQFWVLVVARIVTALAASAFFGIAVAVCVRLVPPARHGRALATLFGGLMVAHVVGLPAAALVDQHFGWRASFWAVAGLAVLSTLAVARLVPATSTAPGRIDLRAEISAFRNGPLWGAYGTNALIIGAIMAANSYFSPIFVDVTGFPSSAVPWLFGLFGVGTIIGNMVMGRFTDRYMMPMLGWGFAAVAVVLAVFALVARNPAATLVAVAVLGLIGLPLSPVMSARVIQVSNEGPLVSTVNASAVNVGVVVGPWAGGLAIDADLGLTSPLWIGCGMAAAGLLAVLPVVLGGGRTERSAAAGEAAAPADRAAAERSPG